MAGKVSDYMSRKVISVKPDTGVRVAFFKMKEHHIRHLPVVDKNNKLIGIVSDRELRRPDWVDESLDIAHIYYLNDEMSVGDVMIQKVLILHTYDNLRRAVKTLLENNIGATPVLDKTGELVGMLSAVDLLHAFETMLDEKKKEGK